MKSNARKQVIFMSGSSGVAELNLTAPAITPTVGATKITNGGFDSDASGWTGTSASLASVAGGQSGNCLQVTNSAGYGYGYQQTAALTVGEYYQLEAYEKNGGAGGLIRWANSANGTDYANHSVTSATFAQRRIIARVTSATNVVTLILNSGGFPQTVLYDTVSVCPLTDTTVLLGDIQRKNGTYICHPTVAQYSIAGFDVNWLDANNLVRATVQRNANVAGDTTAKLLKRIAGTWTEVITGTITYVAGAALKVVVSGTTFQLYYNDVQVGTNQTIDNSGLGTKVYGFNTLAGNTVGTVTTNP